MRAFCVPVLVLALFCFVSVAGQERGHDAEKAKQAQIDALVEQIIGEIPNLRLAENRAFVYARLGNVIWETDRAAAGSLFQKSVGELGAHLQHAAEARKPHTYQNEILTGQATRPQILNLIAGRDAELALDALYRTRPPMLTEALRMQPHQSRKISNYANNLAYLVQNETTLEQTILRLAAEQSPERAAKLLKQGIEKGLSHETFSLLRKVYEKDPVTADELTGAVVGRLIKNKFMLGNQPDHQAINIAHTLLNNFVEQRPPNTRFVASDPGQMRNLAERLIAFYMEPSPHNFHHQLEQMIKIAEKLVPGSVGALRRLQVESRRRSYVDEYHDEINKLLSSENSPENLIAAAAKFPVASRSRLFEAAANKYVQQGNPDAARDLLEENYSDDALNNALSNMNWAHIHQLISQGRFAEAERLIDELPDDKRVHGLVNLANAAWAKNKEENRSYALAVLGKTRSLIGERPENSNEMSWIVQIGSAYANIDPDEAFRLFHSVVRQLNELSDAAVVVYGFQGSSNIRQGEMLIAQGYSLGFYFDNSSFTRLAEKDIAKTVALIDAFSRPETRIMLKLELAGTGSTANRNVRFSKGRDPVIGRY